MKKKENSAAILTIKRPGAMSVRGREEIVKWLRLVARNLKKYGKHYTEKGNFTARYIYK